MEWQRLGKRVLMWVGIFIVATVAVLAYIPAPFEDEGVVGEVRRAEQEYGPTPITVKAPTIALGLSIIAGGLITVAVAWVFFYAASRELRKHVKQLTKLINIILRSLESAGLAELNRDEKGNIIGLVIHLKLKEALKAEGTLTAKATVRHADGTEE